MSSSALGPVRRERLSDSVAEALRQQIRDGGLEPGARLPGHRELADVFKVGLSSVREAISMLASEGLVETRAGRGTFVTAPRHGVQLTQAGARLSTREVEEVIEAREALELQLAGMAAERASEADIAKLQGILGEMQAAVENAAAYAEADVRLHLAIAEAGRNRFLLQAITQLRDLLRENMEISFQAAMERTGDLRFSVESHRELVAAIEAGDPEAARKVTFAIMSRHHALVLGQDVSDAG